MRHLIWYLRTAFCSHKWEYEEIASEVVDYHNTDIVHKRDWIVSATCTNCGWHRKYKKF